MSGTMHHGGERSLALPADLEAWRELDDARTWAARQLAVQAVARWVVPHFEASDFPRQYRLAQEQIADGTFERETRRLEFVRAVMTMSGFVDAVRAQAENDTWLRQRYGLRPEGEPEPDLDAALVGQVIGEVIALREQREAEDVGDDAGAYPRLLPDYDA